MTFNWRHIALVIGMALIIFSFVFFGINTNTYSLVLLVGIIISVISFFTVILQKASKKSKLLWTLIVVAAIFVQWLTEPIFIRLSYVLLVKRNESAFSN